ncbi:hypothetical protein [Hymenobacter guriensis]|nr:hypothetical protein [Hymenobacter guriensis]
MDLPDVGYAHEAIDELLDEVMRHQAPTLNLDEILMTAPAGHGYRLDLIAEPQYAVVPTAYYNNMTGFYGFKVGFPIRLWCEYVLPHAAALIAGPVTLFGHTLQVTGWSAMISPVTPIRSTDQLVWVAFEAPEHAACSKCANNLTCAPGAREVLAAQPMTAEEIAVVTTRREQMVASLQSVTPAFVEQRIKDNTDMGGRPLAPGPFTGLPRNCDLEEHDY